MKTAGWLKLLEDDDFRRWHENLARGSTGTAVERARVLYRFLNAHDMTPRALVDLAKQNRRQVEDLLSDFVGKLSKDGKSPGYVENYLKAVRSWLEYNEIRLVRRIKIPNSGATPTIDEEVVPTAKELRTILCYAGERARCSIGFIAFAGLRPEVLGNERGIDGLKIEDLPDIKIENEQVSFTKTPPMVVVRATLSKIKKRYFTFLASEGCEYLKAYLEKRIAIGEEFNPESPVISVTPGYEKMGKSPVNRSFKFIATRNITREIREAIRPRFKWRPYVLRAYFDTQLLIAENQGKTSHAYTQFFMGHKGDMDARYTTGKGRLTGEMIEDMRKSFEKCDEYLSTVPSKGALNVEEVKIDVLLSVADAQGYRKETIDAIREAVMKSETPTADKVIQMLKEKAADLRSSIFVNKEKAGLSDKPYQGKLVNEEEIVAHIEAGWEMIKELKDGKFLIKRPNHIQK